MALLQNLDSRALCIISPHEDAYSETFVHAHIQRLPGPVKLLCGGYTPQFWMEGNRPFLPVWLGLAARGIDRLFYGAALVDRIDRSSLARFLRRKGISAVLAEFGPTGVSVMDACADAHVPLIVHFHGFDAYHGETLGTFGKDYPRLFKKCAAVVAVSKDMEIQLRKMGATDKKLYYNPYGVDTAQFGGADPADARPLFVAVGRFVDKKAPHLTLLAFSKVAADIPDAGLIMIGDGPLWEACKQLARALGVTEKVEFPGPLSHTEVAATMRRARAFVHHSTKTTYGDSEGTPVAILEAGATGLPVVSTRHAGIGEVVLDGITGFLVPEGDVDGMADHMISLAEDPHLAAKLGRAGRERVSAEFSMEKSIGNLWRIIESAIEGRAKK